MRISVCCTTMYHVSCVLLWIQLGLFLRAQPMLVASLHPVGSSQDVDMWIPSKRDCITSMEREVHNSVGGKWTL